MIGQAVSGWVRTNSNSHPSLEDSRLSRWSLYALTAFPLVDFALRMQHIHPLGVIWDKVVMLVLVVLAVMRWADGYRQQPFHWQRYAGWFIVYALALMFSGLSHPLTSLQGFRIDVYYILYAFLIPFVVGPKDVPKLLHAVALVMILVAVHGVFQYVIKVPNPHSWQDLGESLRTRVFSVMQSPNELGSYMALATPFLFGLFLYETDRWRKAIYLFGIVFAVMTLFLTFTRGAWFALAIAVLIMATLFERRLLIVLVVLGIAAFFLPAIHHRIADLFSPVYWIKSSQSGRVYRWIMAYDKMSNNPLFGVGLGKFGGAVASQYSGGLYSDNYYAKTLGETGLIGLTLFLIMHLALFAEIFRKTVRKAKGRVRFLVIGAATGLLAVLIHNAMENVFEFAPMAITYFLIATLLLVWGRGLPESFSGAEAESGGAVS
ncbi:O-antigen ligase family protein [Alicyclobacillus ferrooxydans]|uniref:O-antigen ligase family protein n=1 Tax=Alicyclobacillus ferrooxydans TaxID=471514 RepID=UPI0006D599DD|nr:O-antigen ligase family protein [Alicyclobacillus ferrooxydans]